LAKPTKAEIAECLEIARRAFKPGDRVYWSIEHRSASGMSRWLRFYWVDDDGVIRNVTPYVAAARGVAMSFRAGNGGRGEVLWGGCGFCAGSEGVESLSGALGYFGADALRAEGL
jgi:hypothetical protein